ncbi:MAG: hypothetical protein B0W54_12505 [Cellvibrio sp. 79]|nr:MAG: hypothetical protein B0W54_12505 [Cellvibrio sp. 79]
MDKGTKATFWLGALTFFLFAFMLFFRAFIYADMYIEPGAPYGISDIIELLLACIFLLLIIISVCFAVVLLVKRKTQSKKAALYLVAFCTLLFAAYSPLHTLAARLGSS